MAGSELFAVDEDLVVQLLSSLGGRQVFPKGETKGEVFDKVTEERQAKEAAAVVPDGTYRLKRKTRGGDMADAIRRFMVVSSL